MASTLSFKVGTTARPLSPNLSLKSRRLRAEAPRIASAYTYTVMLMSDQAEGGRYLNGVQSGNSNAPSNIYGDKGFVSIAIRTISFLSPTVAQVRYTKIITMGQNTPVAQNWNAIMTFKFTTAPEHEKDRNLNPLGFQVVNYRSDPEA